jgi:hypothetical protein
MSLMLNLFAFLEAKGFWGLAPDSRGTFFDKLTEVIAKPSISRIFGTKKIGPWSLALNHTYELEAIENAEF